MKQLRYIFLLLLFSYFGIADVDFIEKKLDFGKVFTGNKVSKTLTIKNYSAYPAKIKSIKFFNEWNAYSVDSASFGTIAPNSDKNITINFAPVQNVIHREFLYITFEYNKYNSTSVAELIGSAYYNDLYDNFFNLSKDSLRIGLNNKVKNHKSFTYKEARTYMFSKVDNMGGWVECIYTGRKLQTNDIPDVNTTHFNCEHTWPQSLGADNEPQKSDLFHIRVSYETANTKRDNFPFGYVTSGITYEDGGSKLGKDKANNTVFEVRDKYKGDIARGLFYFALRYGNPNQYLNNQYPDLYNWNNFDLPDTVEKARNNEISLIQLVRNPFIDHPELIDRDPFNLIRKLNRAFVSQDTLNFDLSNVDASKTLNIYLISNFDTKIKNCVVKSTDNVFVLNGFDEIIKANDVNIIRITGMAIKSDESTGTLTFQLEDGSVFNVVLNTIIPKVSVNDNKVDNNILVYPNPSKSIFTFSTPIISNSEYKLDIFDINGNKVKELKQYSNSDCIELDFLGYASREYFYVLKSNNKEFFGKIVKE
jgi:deoxyribonuclease-1